MKKVLKFFAALAAVAGIVYLTVKYIDKILEVVEQIKAKVAALENGTEEEPVEEAPVEEATEEAPAAEETAEEAPAEEAAPETPAEEAPAEEVEEAPVDENAVVADEADFEQ